MDFYRLREDKGFTLVEVMVTVTLLAITLIPMMAMFYYSSQFTSRSREREVAIHYAEEKMEAIRNTSYSNITPANLPDESKTASGVVFTRHTGVETAPTGFSGSGAADITKITVTVSWVDYGGASRSLSLVTYREKKLEEQSP